MNQELLITISALVIEVLLFLLCMWRSRRPVDPLKPRLIPLAWAAIVDAGAPILPPGIARRWTVDEGYRHVVELRIGKSYRVSVIECAARPETPDDFRVQKVAGILARIFPEAQIGCTR